MQVWFKVLLFILMFLVVLSFFTFVMSIFPRQIVTDLIPSDLGLKYWEVSFKSKDEIELNGWFIPNNKSKSAIIVMHGYPADKANLLGTAEFLAKDFNVFLFDFRSFGKSQGKYTSVGYHEEKDLMGAIDFLEKEKNITKVGLYGFSLGGAVALMAEHKNVKVIVSDSSYARLRHMVNQMYGPFSVLRYPLAYLTRVHGIVFLQIDINKVNPIESIKDKNIPILLIHGEEDSQIPVSEAHLLHGANKGTELWTVKGADHGMSHSMNAEKYEGRVIGFFKENLK